MLLWLLVETWQLTVWLLVETWQLTVWLLVETWQLTSLIISGNVATNSLIISGNVATNSLIISGNVATNSLIISGNVATNSDTCLQSQINILVNVISLYQRFLGEGRTHFWEDDHWCASAEICFILKPFCKPPKILASQTAIFEPLWLTLCP